MIEMQHHARNKLAGTQVEETSIDVSLELHKQRWENEEGFHANIKGLHQAIQLLATTIPHDPSRTMSEHLHSCPTQQLLLRRQLDCWRQSFFCLDLQERLALFTLLLQTFRGESPEDS